MEKKIQEATEKITKKVKDEFITYDIVNDCVDPRTGEPLVTQDMSIVERYFAFRKNEIDYDADCSLEANIIYEKVFGEIINRLDTKVIRRQREGRYNRCGMKYELGEPDCKGGLSYRGDTMNSVATTLWQYYWAHKELHNDERLEGFSWPQEVQNLMYLYHTPGNFMPLPWRNEFSINCARGTGSSKDYFDLFLLAIYNFFLEQNGKDPLNKVNLTRILGGNSKLKLFMKYYLLPFIDTDKCRFDEKPSQLIDDIEDGSRMLMYVLPGWEAFIEQNLLQDHVETAAYGHFGKPLELWEGHFDCYANSSKAVPYREDQYMAFWTNAADRIRKRSARIYEKLVKEGI